MLGSIFYQIMYSGWIRLHGVWICIYSIRPRGNEIQTTHIIIISLIGVGIPMLSQNNGFKYATPRRIALATNIEPFARYVRERL